MKSEKPLCVIYHLLKRERVEGNVEKHSLPTDAQPDTDEGGEPERVKE